MFSKSVYPRAPLNNAVIPQQLLYHAQLPFAAPEDKEAYYTSEDIRYKHRPENTPRAEAQTKRQGIRERHLHHPETEYVDPGRGHGITGTIEGLDDGHAGAPGHECRGKYAQALHGIAHNHRLLGKEFDDRMDEQQHQHGGNAHIDRVVFHDFPNRSFGALG